MLKFEWNTLRTGDDVLVHDPSTSRMALLPGVVAAVHTHKRRKEVGMRVATKGGTIMLWPARLAVHRAPRDPLVPCWRCETLTATAEESALGLRRTG